LWESKRPPGAGVRRFPLLGLVLLTLILAATGLPGGAAAQEGPRLLASSVESQFPKGILFRLEVAGPRDITEITLRFRLVAERFARYDRLEFAPSPSVRAELLVRTDTAERFIPPGAELEYFFEVKDVGGVTLVTPPQRFTLLDPRFTWEQVQGDGVSILYHGPLQALAQEVLKSTQATLRRMGALMGVQEHQPLRLTLYNTWSEMRQALPPKSQVQESTLITEGTLFPDTGVILVLGSIPRVAGVTSHEVVHFLMEEAMGSLTRIVPAWLNEGLAEYGSTGPNPSFDRALAQALAQGRLLPLTSLTSPPGVPEDVILMYGQGKSVVAYLVETYGAGPFQALLANLRQGLGIDAALEAAYGFDRQGLDNRWRKVLGAPPLPAGGPGQGRPTPVPYPSIVPFGAETPTPFLPAAASQTPASNPPAAASGACGRAQGPADPLPWLALGMVAALAVRRRTGR
jgi:hypothetical protein